MQPESGHPESIDDDMATIRKKRRRDRFETKYQEVVYSSIVDLKHMAVFFVCGGSCLVFSWNLPTGLRFHIDPWTVPRPLARYGSMYVCMIGHSAFAASSINQPMEPPFLLDSLTIHPLVWKIGPVYLLLLCPCTE